MRKTTKFLLVAMVAMTALLMGCAQENKSQPDKTADNYRVFYQVFVGSFSDSNGDGIGDLRGIINRMDYLNDGNMYSEDSLGVQGLWLSPIFSSPSYHKYDATDYYKIDPKFGTEEDLKELLTICEERNVKVILDLVINHTSRSNVWFQKFTSAHKNGDPSDPYYDFYSWTNLSERENGKAYSTIPGCAGQVYECNFDSGMPELNYDNPTVKEEMLKVAKYYLDLGVDGFRFDAIKYIYYNDTKRSSAFWDWYMGELKAYKPDIYCVGECWSADGETLEYVSSLNCFNFQIAQQEGYIANAAKGGNIETYTKYVQKYQGQVKAENSTDGMMIPFIANHDMDRAAGYLTVFDGKAYVGANLLMLTPGSPFIYYGEEIAMKGTRGGANTDANRRLAMLWGDEDTVKNPTGSTYSADKQKNGTVVSQLEDENSLLHHYRDLIRIRKDYPEIARGDYQSLAIGKKNFGGFVITYEDAKTYILHNTSTEEIQIDLGQYEELSAGGYKLAESVGLGEAKLDGTTLTIAPQTSAILK